MVEEHRVSRDLSHASGVKLERSCTCHPDDNPPLPCAQRYALSECRSTESAACVLTDDTDPIGAASLDDLTREIASTNLNGDVHTTLEYVLRRGFTALGIDPRLSVDMCRKLAECQYEDAIAKAVKP